MLELVSALGFFREPTNGSVEQVLGGPEVRLLKAKRFEDFATFTESLEAI